MGLRPPKEKLQRPRQGVFDRGKPFCMADNGLFPVRFFLRVRTQTRQKGRDGPDTKPSSAKHTGHRCAFHSQHAIVGVPVKQTKLRRCPADTKYLTVLVYHVVMNQVTVGARENIPVGTTLPQIRKKCRESRKRIGSYPAVVLDHQKPWIVASFRLSNTVVRPDTEGFDLHWRFFGKQGCFLPGAKLDKRIQVRISSRRNGQNRRKGGTHPPIHKEDDETY